MPGNQRSESAHRKEWARVASALHEIGLCGDQCPTCQVEAGLDTFHRGDYPSWQVEQWEKNGLLDDELGLGSAL